MMKTLCRTISERKKGTMEEEGNPNEPMKAMAPGQEGGRQGDREKEKERQREIERVEATYGGAGYNRVEGPAEPGTRRPFISSGKGWNAPNQALRYIDESDKTLDPNYVAALKRGEYETRADYARAFPREFINHPELKSAPQDVQDLVAAARGGTVLGRQQPVSLGGGQQGGGQQSKRDAYR